MGSEKFKCFGPGCKISTLSGTILGLNSGNLVEFRGIPYAQAPVDQLRFRSPVFRDFNQTLIATNYAKNCATNNFGPGQDEDCLYLNVIIPKIAASGKNKLPVVFYIHGGGFNHGTSQVKGENNYIFDQSKDIILKLIRKHRS